MDNHSDNVTDADISAINIGDSLKSSDTDSDLHSDTGDSRRESESSEIFEELTLSNQTCATTPPANSPPTNTPLIYEHPKRTSPIIIKQPLRRTPCTSKSWSNTPQIKLFPQSNRSITPPGLNGQYNSYHRPQNFRGRYYPNNSLAGPRYYPDSDNSRSHLGSRYFTNPNSENSRSHSGSRYFTNLDSENSTALQGPRYFFEPHPNSYQIYNPIENCKSAGIIPYVLRSDSVMRGSKLYFLFQRLDDPIKKKDSGWNDFGGKKSDIQTETTVQTETTPETAGREFSEETSCLFYIKETNPVSTIPDLYHSLTDNPALIYSEEIITELKTLIPLSKNFYAERITNYADPLYVSSKETYISFFVKVQYIPVEDLPRAEDIHINYPDKYLRTCKWFSIDEILSMNEKEFHKRLQITKIIQRIKNLYMKGVFE